MGIFWRIKKAVRKTILKPPPYRYAPSHDVVKDYSLFSGLSITEVEGRIRSYKALTKDEWNKLPPGDFDSKAGRFYGRSEYYICDIIAANVSKDALRKSLDEVSPRILQSIRNHSGKRFLEFGGGTGVFCEMVAEMGKEVTYLDIPGRQYDFAKWRFERYKVPVKMICSQPGKLALDGEYDIIFTNAVMEHLPDPGTPTRELCRHLAKGGIFVMLVDLSGEEDDMPMHRDVDIVKLHQAMLEEGLENAEGLHKFWSIWTRPATP